MIALDSSALVAILMGEPEKESFSRLVANNDCIIGAPTSFEAVMVARAKMSEQHLKDLYRILQLDNVSTIEFTRMHGQVADAAFERFGKGRGHPARLNFGDCMAYAVAKVASIPLLYKGNDFAHTDIIAACTP
jgi:ribonuclease VapC